MDVTPARRATSIIFSVLAGCLACFGGRNAFLDVEDIDHAWVVAASCFFFAITFRIGFWGWEQMLIGAEKSKLIPEFSSYFMAGFHGIGITAISFYLLSIDDDWHDFNDANTPAQNLALCISLGYFIADTFVYLIPYTPGEVVFVVHHVGTALFLIASLHLQRASTACLFGLFIGELTNPLFHIWNILDGLRPWHPFADQMFRWWAPLFTTVFLAVRTVAGPISSWWWCNKVAVMDAPVLHKAIWIAASVGIMLVSQFFSVDFVKHTYNLLKSPSQYSQEAMAKGGENGVKSVQTTVARKNL